MSHQPIFTDLDQPLGHNESFCSENPISLIVEGPTLISPKKGYTIKTLNGESLLQTQDQWSIHKAKILRGAHGQEIMSLSTRLALTSQMLATLPNGAEAFRIRSEWCGCKCRLTAEFEDALTLKKQQLELIVGELSGTGHIRFGGQDVAYVHKDHWYSQKRRLEIAANMDYTIIAAMVILMNGVLATGQTYFLPAD